MLTSVRFRADATSGNCKILWRSRCGTRRLVEVRSQGGLAMYNLEARARHGWRVVTTRDDRAQAFRLCRQVRLHHTSDN
jgi:hypothetical protein